MNTPMPSNHAQYETRTQAISQEQSLPKNKKNSRGSVKTNSTDNPIDLIERLIQKEIALCAEQLNLDSEEVESWVQLHMKAPSKSILQALRTARQYELDLLAEDVLLSQLQEGWQVSISVDGWIKLINGHPAFTGLSFTQSTEEVEGVPIWMECTIHRSDRVISTTVREYLVEVRKESEMWQKMPRRMLRHRVMQQCARMAFGVGSGIQYAETASDAPIVDSEFENHGGTTPKHAVDTSRASQLKNALLKS